MAFLLLVGIVALVMGGLYAASRVGHRRDISRLGERMGQLGMEPVADPAAAIGTELLVLAPSFEAELAGGKLLGITPSRRRFTRTGKVEAAWARTPSEGPGVVAWARVKYRVTTRGGLTRDTSSMTDDIVIGRLNRSIERSVLLTPAVSGDPASNPAHRTEDQLLGTAWSVIESEATDRVIPADSQLRAALWSMRIWESDSTAGAALESIVPRGPTVADLHGIEIRGDVIAVGAAAHPYRAGAADELISLVEHAIEHI